MQAFFVNPKCNNDCIQGFLDDSGYKFERIQEGIWYHYIQRSRVEVATTLTVKNVPMKIDTVLDAEGGKLAQEVAKKIYDILIDLCNPDYIVGSCCMMLDKTTLHPIFDENGDPIMVSL